MKVKDAILELKKLENLSKNLSLIFQYVSTDMKTEELEEIEKKIGVDSSIRDIILTTSLEIDDVKNKLQMKIDETEILE